MIKKREIAKPSPDMESVTFGSALETIGERAFASAKISSLVLPATVRTIGDWE
jgi:hypothetical protein